MFRVSRELFVKPEGEKGVVTMFKWIQMGV